MFAWYAEGRGSSPHVSKIFLASSNHLNCFQQAMEDAEGALEAKESKNMRMQVEISQVCKWNFFLRQGII